jgi:lipopolysaccharide biosynthesis protein
LGTPKIIDNIHDVFNRAPDVGVIAPRKYVISSLEQDFMEHNYAKVIDLARRGNIHYEKGDAFTYCAGTMFWFRPQALALINSINISPSEFETEKGQLTSTYAHAFERFIGLVVQEAGYKISSVG